MKTPEELGIKIKHQREGTQKLKCPQCQPDKHNMKDNPLSFTINSEGCVWFCHHCDWKGSYAEKKYSFAKPVKSYTKPKTPTERKTEKMYKYFENRGISKKVIDDHKIFQEESWIGFQYFNAEGVLENIKYRGLHNKAFKQTQGAKPYLYNYNNVYDKETIVFVEGEVDVLSLAEIGMYATSLPNGAPKEAKFNEKDARFSPLSNCPLEATKIILFTDKDEAGEALHKELLHRFGRDICWYVDIPDECKDANDVLVKYGSVKLKEIIDKAEPYPIDGLYRVRDYSSQVLDLYEGNYVKPYDIGMKGLDEIYKIMTGTFHTITGIPNHGKSIFLDQILLSLAIKEDWRFAVFSPEHSTSMHIRRLVQMYTQKNFDEGFSNRMTKDELSRGIDFINEHFFFIETRDIVPNIENILQIAKSSVFKYGVNGLVIDPYNEVDAKRSGNAREDEHIRDFISLCKRFARIYEVVCWVVAHPTKLPKGTDGSYMPPTAYDVSGSAHWHNQSDAVLTIYRDFEENTTNVITRKIREQDLYGKIGEAKFTYNIKKKTFEPYEKLVPSDWNEISFDD